MKARLLKKLLNNTGYTVANYDKYIAVGSPLCHNLINIDKATLRLRYQLDFYDKGRNFLVEKGNEELLFIWDTLKMLIDTGEIVDIINGRDIIENPLPVFTVEEGKVIASVTDSYDWPNTDDNGVMMFINTHFRTIGEAVQAGIHENKERLVLIREQIVDNQAALRRLVEKRDLLNKYLADLQAIVD